MSAAAAHPSLLGPPGSSPAPGSHPEKDEEEKKREEPGWSLAVPGLLFAVLAAGCDARAPEEVLPRALRPVPADLVAAEARWKAAPDDLDALIWYGRRLGYEGRFEEAV